MKDDPFLNLIRPYLAVGSLRDTQDASLLAHYHITAVVSIAEAVSHEGIASLFVPFDDGTPLSENTVQKVVDLVRTQKDANRVTALACAWGVSRSASLAIAAIKEIEGLDLLTAYCIVKRARPEIQPHIVLWQSLCGLYGENVSYLKMLRAECSENPL